MRLLSATARLPCARRGLHAAPSCFLACALDHLHTPGHDGPRTQRVRAGLVQLIAILLSCGASMAPAPCCASLPSRLVLLLDLEIARLQTVPEDALLTDPGFRLVQSATALIAALVLPTRTLVEQTDAVRHRTVTVMVALAQLARRPGLAAVADTAWSEEVNELRDLVDPDAPPSPSQS